MNHAVRLPSMERPWLKYHQQADIDAPIPDSTVYEFLVENNHDHPSDTAILYLDTAITYGELFERIDQCAKALLALGVGRDDIVTMYLKHAERANNWDLVDLSAPKTVGHWLLLPTRLGDKREIMDGLAASPNLWRQRISIVSTWKTTQAGDPSWCMRYAEWHLHHPHDLMHKAVGWMLREVGKRGNMDLLRDFLDRHAHEMPRTMLRYAIEKMTDDERRYWMAC